MIDIVLNDENFSRFVSCTHRAQECFGKKPSSFAKFQSSFVNSGSPLPSKRMSRLEVFNEVRTRDNPFDIFLIIMAWGGMDLRHCAYFVKSIETKKDAQKVFAAWVKDLKSGALSRQQAYSSFQVFLKNNDIKGIGPAYYTKLIFFLSHHSKVSSRGYIMDQWTSKSVDLLLSKLILNSTEYDGSLIKMSPQSNKTLVYSTNESIRYEYFCMVTDFIGNELEKISNDKHIKQCWGEIAEERMFSEGRGHGEWRNFVKETWSKRPAMEFSLS